MPDSLPHDGKRIFLTGVFDMQNFGDLLFPLVARRRMGLMGVDVIPVSPTGAPTGMSDAMATVDIAEMLSGDTRVDGIVVGGGYLIHTHRMDVLREYKDGNVGEWLGPGIWLGAALAAGLRDVPLAWNAPGVPHPIAPSQRRVIDAALRAASYLSVRDQGGAELLAAPGDAPVVVVPDPLSDLASLWSRRELEAPFHALVARKGFSAETQFVAVHFRNRSIAGQEPAETAALLSAFAKEMGLTPLLTAVGSAHDDDITAQSISAHLDIPHIVLDDPASLKETAAALAHARFYVGASLHGYITAAAYGVPGVLIARPAYRKFAGFLEHTGRMEDLVRDWRAAYAAALSRKGESLAQRIPDAVFTALDEHWRRIGEAIANPATGAAGRRRFLSELLAFGVGELGPAWAMQPLSHRAARFVPMKK